MSEINRIRERFRRITDLKSEASATNASDLPIDHQLTFQRDAGEQWTFRDGHIYLNDEDIEDLLNEARDDVKFQSAVSDAVSEYRELVWKKGNGSFAKFSVRADAIQDKILCNMKRIYDERTGGVRLAWGDGACLLNNLNVRAILAMYHIRPTEKARKFLKGLKSKLALILVNKNGSPHFERVNSVVKSLYNEVDSALDKTPIDGCYLPCHNGHNSGQ